MKKEFSDLVKIKKEDLKDLETKIREKNIQKESILKEIKELQNEIDSSSLPSEEKMGILNLFKESIKKTREAINQKKSFLKNIDQELESLQESYKEASIEYEKIKYIDQLSTKRYKEKIQRKEQKDLDEISSLLYMRNRR